MNTATINEYRARYNIESIIDTLIADIDETDLIELSDDDIIPLNVKTVKRPALTGNTVNSFLNWDEMRSFLDSVSRDVTFNVTRFHSDSYLIEIDEIFVICESTDGIVLIDGTIL